MSFGLVERLRIHLGEPLPYVGERPVEHPHIPTILQVLGHQRTGPLSLHQIFHVLRRGDAPTVPAQPVELPLRRPVAAMQPTDPPPPTHPDPHVRCEQLLSTLPELLAHPRQLSVELPNERRPTRHLHLFIDLVLQPVQTSAAPLESLLGEFPGRTQRHRTVPEPQHPTDSLEPRPLRLEEGEVPGQAVP